MQEATREKILTICKQLGYLPNSAGRNLRLQKTETIGLVYSLPFSELFQNVFNLEVVAGLAAALEEKGYDLLLSHPREVPEAEDVPRFIRQGKVDGVVLLSSMPRSYLNQLTSWNLPFILLDSHVEDLRVDSITSDGRNAARQAVQHLVECGHRRIAIMAYEFPDYNTDQRIQGFQEGCQEHGLTCGQEVIRSFDSGSKALARLLARLKEPDPPTAVLAINDTLACELLVGLRNQGVRVPQEVSLIGFDDDPMSHLSRPSLTTLAVDKRVLGRSCAKRLLERIHQPDRAIRNEQLPMKLVSRESVATL
jgi:LacI family transcriptional regulator